MGSAITTKRLGRGWSARELAVVSGVAEPTIRRGEAGVKLSPLTIAKLAVALGITPEALQEAIDDETKSTTAA